MTEKEETPQDNQTTAFKNGEEPSSRRLPSTVKWTLVILLVFLSLFLLWASLYPIQQGAPAHGIVVVADYRRVVQHPYGGSIKKIYVREGDKVKKEQPLIELEESEIRAQFTQIRTDYFNALLQRARLITEKNGYPKIQIPSEILSIIADPVVQRLVTAQEELFKARREKMENEKRLLQHNINGLEEYLRQLNMQLQHQKIQLKLLEGQLNDLKPLAEEGYYPKNRYIDIQRQAEAIRSQIAEIMANIKKSEVNINELKQKLVLLDKDYRREIETELAEVEKKISALRDTYLALEDRLSKIIIRAPEDGIVMALRFHSVGMVIKPAEPILEIVPLTSDLLIEAKLSPLYIEEVKIGQEVDLHFTALDPKKTPVLTGSLVYISPDAQTEVIQGTTTTYYLLRIKPTKEALEKIHSLNKEIMPGMPVDVIVKTGKRPFISYILKPFVDRMSKAFLR